MKVGRVDEVEHVVASEAPGAEQLLGLLRKGLAQRVVAEHALNADSSRSHMVFSVRLRVQGLCRKLTFVDLGGCERLKRSEAAGDLQKEAREIGVSGLFGL